jgi:protein tyrosine/serine phosphatase
MRWFLVTTAAVVATTAAFFALDVALNVYRSALVPKNFSVVEPNVLYRSGQMKPRHFTHVLEHYGIRTVVCLNPDDAPQERALAQRSGVRFVGLSMPGSGQGDPAYFHQALELIADPASRPVLVHCAAGAYRTGATVALYRMLFQGWRREDVVAEMAYSGFAGQADLIEHIDHVFATIPPALHQRAILGHRPIDISIRAEITNARQ